MEKDLKSCDPGVSFWRVLAEVSCSLWESAATGSKEQRRLAERSLRQLKELSDLFELASADKDAAGGAAACAEVLK